MYEAQSLESRRLLSVDPIFSVTSKGTLIITGTPGKDEIVVQLTHDKPSDGLQAFVTTFDDSTPSDVRHQFRSSFKNVKRIRVEAGEGDDSVSIGGGSNMTRPATLLGGAGNDRLSFSGSGAIFADGGDGLDTLDSSQHGVTVNSKKNRDVIAAAFADEDVSAVNTLLGGAGDDTIGGNRNDSIDGGAGNDTCFLQVSPNDVSQERRDALAHDYFERQGALSIEITKGSAGSFSTIIDRITFE